MPRNCKNDPNIFCYVCGQFTSKNEICEIKEDIKHYYLNYFQCHLGDQDKSWAPHVICTGCDRGLRDYATGKKKSMPFQIPMI